MRTPINKPYRITSRYGNRFLDGVTKMHHGVDLVPADGRHPTNINAACGGMVVDVVNHLPDTHTGLRVTTHQRGNYVCIRTPEGFSVWYMHLKEKSITHKKGDIIVVGQKLGTMGSTGYSTGIHLHYELRKADGSSFDPEPYLNNNRPITWLPLEENIPEKIPGTVRVNLDGVYYQPVAENKDNAWYLRIADLGNMTVSLRDLLELGGYKNLFWDKATETVIASSL